MKKRVFTILMASAMSLTCFSYLALAATKNEVSQISNVSKGMVLNKGDAPVLVLKATTDHEEDFQFELNLTGAIWTYSSSGTFTRGVTYTKYTDTWMVVSVDMSKFDATKQDIVIPLYTEITGDGDAIIEVNGGETTVSSGTYSFTSQAKGKIKLETDRVDSMSETGTLNDIIIDDSTTGSVKENTTYLLRLDNGFRFTNQVTPKGTGKYENAVRFHFDPDMPSDGYLTVTKSTKEGVGKIVLSGVEVKKTKTSNYGTVILSMLIGTDSQSVEAAQYVKYSESGKELELLYVNETSQTPTMVGEGTPGVIVKIEIDGEEFGTTTVGANGRWTMQYPETKDPLSEGTHTFSATYFDKTINRYVGEITQKFTIELPYGIVFTIDSNTYTVEGEGHPLDAPAYIDENGRTMLPLRAFVNAMGISDQNVDWNERDQTVTIKREDGNTIKITIGEDQMMVNGVSKKIDTKAVIKDGRTFLPMRPLLNAMGINDNNIVWKPVSQSVIVKIK